MWRTSNPNVLTVENGVVTAVGPGTAIINFKINNTVDRVLEIPYTVNYHQLPEDTPVTGPTATQPKQAVGHCSVCGKDDAANIYGPAIFTDTVATSWYAEHVDKVFDLKLMNGTGEHTFAPNANVTRAQFATIISRYMTTVDPLTPEKPDPDIPGPERPIPTPTNPGVPVQVDAMPRLNSSDF